MIHRPHPLRFQRRRTRGWRLPERGASLARPHPLGNPYLVCHDRGTWYVLGRDLPSRRVECVDELAARKLAVHLYETNAHIALTIARLADSLRGRPLGCWCALELPCHVDWVLAAVNA